MNRPTLSSVRTPLLVVAILAFVLSLPLAGQVYHTSQTTNDLRLAGTAQPNLSAAPANTAITPLASLSADTHDRLLDAMGEPQSWESPAPSSTYTELDFVEHDGAYYQVIYRSTDSSFVEFFVGPLLGFSGFISLGLLALLAAYRKLAQE